MKQKWHAGRVGDSLDVAGFPCGCDSESPAGIHGELHEVRESLWPSVRSVAAICRTDLNGDHREPRSTARATANEWQAADALVTERCPFDAQGQDRDYEPDHVAAERCAYRPHRRFG
jgi:hypothetical protein